jgi:hypothetical protein
VLGVVEGTPESPTLLGRSLDLSGALVQDEWGQPRELLPGTVIEVQGRVEAQTLKASRVTVHSHLEGPVESVDLASASLSVLGRTVWVNANTRIYQKSAGSYTTLVLGDLRPGDWVEVSGTPDNRGNLIAIYVEGYRVAVDDATRYKVHGRQVTAEAFWSVVQEGNWVEATLTGNTLLAGKLELIRNPSEAFPQVKAHA